MKGFSREVPRMVPIQQAGEAVVDAYDFHAVVQEGRFAHAADGRVDTGAVAAG